MLLHKKKKNPTKKWESEPVIKISKTKKIKIKSERMYERMISRKI